MSSDARVLSLPKKQIGSVDDNCKAFRQKQKCNCKKSNCLKVDYNHQIVTQFICNLCNYSYIASVFRMAPIAIVQNVTAIAALIINKMNILGVPRLKQH